MSAGAFKDYCSPVVGNISISSPYGWRNHPKYKVAKFHSGIDIAGCKGENIYAIEDGVVKKVRRPQPAVDKNGKKYWSLGLVRIEHSNGPIRSSEYLHIKEHSIPAEIQEGKKVKKGQVVGLVGNTGASSMGAHLHFQMYMRSSPRGKTTDPENFFYECCEVKRKLKIKGYHKVEDEDGELHTVPTGHKRAHLKGIYRTNDENQDEKEPEQAPATPTNNAPKVDKEPENKKEAPPPKRQIPRDSFEEEEIEIDKEDISNSLLSFYFPSIVKSSFAKQGPLYGNIVEIDGGENTPILSNLILSKTISKKGGEDYNDISTLEMSNLAPFVELYSVKRNKDRYYEILYPFDDYTSRTQIDTIFYDKTTRGGSVGIQSVEYKTLATNPANKAQISVRIKILIQDIAQIESVRNGITLLDFLYPPGSRNQDEYDSRNFSVKIKVGWKYKDDNPLLEDLQKKVANNMLHQILYCSLHNHSFDFRDDGLVELTMEYIGMIEAEMADPYTHNVLDNLTTYGTGLARTLRSWKQLLSDVDLYGFDFMERSTSRFSRVGTGAEKDEYVQARDWDRDALSGAWNAAKAYGNLVAAGVLTIVGADEDAKDSAKDAAANLEKVKSLKIQTASGEEEEIVVREENIERLKEIVREHIKRVNQEVARSYAQGLTDFLKQVSERGKIKVLAVGSEQIDEIIKISKQRSVDFSTYQNNHQKAKGLLNRKHSWRTVVPESVDEANKNMKFTESISGDSASIDSSAYVESLLDTSSMKDGEIRIPYVLLKDIVSYYQAKFYGPDLVPNQKDLTIFLGSFSYNEVYNDASLKKIKQIYNSGHVTSNTRLDAKGNPYVRVPATPRTESMGNIPISIKSLMDWYNTNIINANLKTLSYHTFLRKLITELVNSSISSSLTSLERQKTIITSFNYLTVPFNKSYTDSLTAISSGFGPMVGGYILDFSQIRKALSSPYYRLLDNAVYKEPAKKRSKRNRNFLFILSRNEIMPSLIGSYRQDQIKNIPHFYMNHEKGFIKNIKFKKEDFAQLDAANIVKANRGNEGQAIIRKVYQSEIDMFGNSIFEPGQIMYLNPSYPGSRLRNPVLHKIGLGGYYQVISINNFLDQNKYSTTLETKWLMSGAGSEKENLEYSSIKVFLKSKKSSKKK